MKALLSTCSFSVLALLAAPAFAQTAAAPPIAAAGPKAPNTGTIEEVVVTAERRSEKEQDVPISMETVTASQAEAQGVSGTESLSVAVPSLLFSRQTGNGGTPYIRGVGTSNAANGAEGPVAVYVDDVYLGSANSNVFQFNNIADVEVLKGPQGTLFGRNATGGVINVHTKLPSETPSLDATVGYGNYDTISGSLYATGPITDTLAANFAFTGLNQRDGYGYNILNGQSTLKQWSYGLRSELLWKPDDKTNVLLAGDYNRYDGDIGMSVVVAPGTLTAGHVAFVSDFGTYDTPADAAPSQNWGVSAKINHDFGPVELVSISAYRFAEFCLNLNTNASLTGAQNLTIGCRILPGFGVPSTFQTTAPSTKTFSQEFHLLSDHGGPLTWLAGAYYYRQEVNAGVGASFGASAGGVTLGTATASVTTVNSYAGFGDATYKVTPDTKVTLGLRYTKDEFERTVPPATADLSKWTYRAVLDHNFTPDILGYASYSLGYHTGGLAGPINVIGVGIITPPPIQPETLADYEVGLKSYLLDKTVKLNLSAFHYDYSNLQVVVVLSGTQLTQNAAAAKMNGVDADIEWVATKNLDFTAGLAFLDAKFTSFPNGTSNIPKPAVCTPTPMTTGAITGGNLMCTKDLTGNQTPRSPPFTGTFGANYTMPTEVGDFIANATYYYNAGFYWEPDNQFKQPHYSLVNANLTFKPAGKPYEFRVWGKNLFNTYYLDYFSTSASRDAGSPAQPRTYGVTFSTHF